MGLLPTYAMVGIAAPVILTLLRLLQGLSVGGQLVGSMLFLVESARREKRGFYGSLVMMTATVGTMSGAWVASIFEAALSADTMESWGWRVPFLLSFVIGVVGFVTQHRMADSHEFRQASRRSQIVRNPLSRAVLKYWRQIVYITGIVAPWSAGFYICFLWLPTYLQNERDPVVPHAFVANSFMFLWICACLLLGGMLSDRFSYATTMKWSALGLAVAAVPSYLAVDVTQHGEVWPMVLTQLVLGVGLGCFGGPMQILMVDTIDDVVVRYCVMGTAYNLCQALFGGTAPIFAELLAKVHLALVGLYVGTLALLALVCLLLKSRTSIFGK